MPNESASPTFIAFSIRNSFFETNFRNVRNAFRRSFYSVTTQ